MACDVCMGINPHKCPVCGPKPERIICPECGGFGLVNCMAWFDDGVMEVGMEVTPERYVMLPEEAKGDADRCPVCNGSGEVWKEGDEYYPVD